MCSFDTTNALPRADPHHTPHTPSTSNFFIPKRNGAGLNKFPMLISGATVRVVPFLLNPICKHTIDPVFVLFFQNRIYRM